MELGPEELRGICCQRLFFQVDPFKCGRRSHRLAGRWRDARSAVLGMDVRGHRYVQHRVLCQQWHCHSGVIQDIPTSENVQSLPIEQGHGQAIVGKMAGHELE